MTLARLIWQSIKYYWQMLLVIFFSIALSTAIISGSLFTGDSINGSLHDTALAGLGTIHYAVHSPDFFRAQVVEDASGQLHENLRERLQLQPLIRLTGIAQPQGSRVTSPDTQVLGIDEDFASGYPSRSLPHIDGRQAVINAALAHDLGVGEGDDIVLYIDRLSAIPLNNLFARRKREERMRTMRVQVAAIIADYGVGGFTLGSSTDTPRNLFISRSWLARQLEQEGKINVLLVKVNEPLETVEIARVSAAIHSSLQLDDYGLHWSPSATEQAFTLQSRRVLLPISQLDIAESTARHEHAITARSSVYLATQMTNLRIPQRVIAYAMLAGVDVPTVSALWLPELASLGKGGIYLNSWAAADLQAKRGDTLDLQYLTAAADGSYRTHRKQFHVAGIVPLSGHFADDMLTPDFEGITTAKSIGDWKPPFTIDFSRITPRDDEYWERYRATPKVYVTLEDAREIWLDNFGSSTTEWITGLTVIPPLGVPVDDFKVAYSARLLAALSTEGGEFVLQPVRARALAAAQATTDFSQLFLSMSIFLILAALALAAMMTRVLVDVRIKSIGVMLATGFTVRVINRLFLLEGSLVTLCAALAGIPLGIFFTQGLIHLLTENWLDAVGTRALWLHVTPLSVFIGLTCGLMVGFAAIALGCRAIGRAHVMQLLIGWQSAQLTLAPATRRLHRWLLLLMLTLGTISLVSALFFAFPSRDVAFFVSGFSLLLAALLSFDLGIRLALSRMTVHSSLLRLAMRNIAANRARSLLTVGLFAAASFLLIAVASNARDYQRSDWTRRDSGSGGFAFKAVCSLPLPYDFATPKGRNLLGFPASDEELFREVNVTPFFANSGDDISCNNIMRTSTPRVLGVGGEMLKRGGFTITTLTPTSDPWSLLQQPLPDGVIPAFADADTVQWSLHSKLGGEYVLPAEHGKPAQRIRFVGLLSSSILASEILISLEHFRTMYPAQQGPRVYLLDVPPSIADQVATRLRANLGEYGLSVRSSGEVMNRYISVQNTYLSTFLTLGGFGVLLGAVGLVAVLLRNAIERRREFALLSAIGFRYPQLVLLLVLEHFGLLLSGMLAGSFAALLAVVPQIQSNEANTSWGVLIMLFCGILIAGCCACALTAAYALRGNTIHVLHEEY